MHNVRRAAHRGAWYTEIDERPNLNPFQKLHKRKSHQPGNSDIEADGAHRSNAPHLRALRGNTLTSIQTVPERPIPSAPPSNERFAPPRHAFTTPISATGVEQRSLTGVMNISPSNFETKNLEDKEMDGGIDRSGTRENSDETVVADDTQENQTNGQPRKRKTGGFLGKFRKDKEEDNEEPNQKPIKFTAMGQLRATLLNSYINVLLVMAPVGIALSQVKSISPVVVFVVNFIAIIPLAAMLSYATEEIALRTGETIGGLLNATFGNAVELIVSILALTQNQVLIVQTSLIGSMLSNLLLVMGMCFFFGGLNRVEQYFNVTVAQTASSLLALAIGSLIIPTAFSIWASGSMAATASEVTSLSRGVAIILLVLYGCYLFFQLKTHTEMYNEPSQKAGKRRVKVAKGDALRGMAQAGANASAATGGDISQDNPMQRDDGPDLPQLSIAVAVFTLAASTALVAVCAEFMVDSINALTTGPNGISKTFVGLILLPIVGNAAEHATAVTVACKDKMDLAIGVAVGSSLQIALFVLPFIVTLGWILGKDTMNLSFDGFQIAVLFVAVLLVNYLIADGKSHWLEGAMLQALYIIIAVAAWFYPANGVLS